MKTHSYEEMKKVYDAVRPIDAIDLQERKEYLSEQSYSVIVEGSLLEFENARKWIKETMHIDSINCLFYNKIGYDFGFIEYFFDHEADSERFKKEIGNIYTTYPNGSCSKSDGHDHDIPFVE